MAKCVGSVNQWKSERVPLESTRFLVENVRQGEAELKILIENLANQLLLEIASDYIRVKQSALGDDEFILDSRKIQDGLVAKLKSLLSQTTSTIYCISSAKHLLSSTKHAYFIQYSYGLIEKLQQFFQTIGRLCEIDQKLYMEEHRKLLVSDESITIHSLTSIWTAVLSILDDFCYQAKSVFCEGDKSVDTDNDDSQSYDFLGELEFSTWRNMTAKIILMDLIISSWIKFNRLLDGVTETSDQSHEDGNQLLHDLLSLILDFEEKPSMMTMSLRRPSIVPLEPCHAGTSKSDLAYFLIWHLHSLASRTKSETSQRMLDNCQNLMIKCFVIVKESFISEKTISRLSPHQEERYKLLFHMLSVWCERLKTGNQRATLLKQLFEFAHMIDSLTNLDKKYFNNSDFRLYDCTLFQYCAKLMNDAVPMYKPDGQTQAHDDPSLTMDQKQLVAIWNVLLDKHVQNSNPSLTKN